MSEENNYRVLYDEFKGCPSGPLLKTPTHTWRPVTMCGFSSRTSIGIPSSEISGFNGDKVPLVKTMDRMPCSTICCILSKRK